MLYIFVIVLIIALICKGKELIHNKTKLYVFLVFSLIALGLGIYYTSNPYHQSVIEKIEGGVGE